MQFTIHTGVKTTPFELHHRRKPRTDLTIIVENGKTYLSNWSEMIISAPNKPKIPNYVGHNAKAEIPNHIIMARTNADEKRLNEGPQSPTKKNSVRYPFYFVEIYQKIITREVPKQNTNHSKQNRDFRMTDTGE